MLRKLIGPGGLAGIGYGVSALADRSGCFGSRDHDRNARMDQIQDAATCGLPR